MPPLELTVLLGLFLLFVGVYNSDPEADLLPPEAPEHFRFGSEGSESMSPPDSAQPTGVLVDSEDSEESEDDGEDADVRELCLKNGRQGVGVSLEASRQTHAYRGDVFVFAPKNSPPSTRIAA